MVKDYCMIKAVVYILLPKIISTVMGLFLTRQVIYSTRALQARELIVKAY